MASGIRRVAYYRAHFLESLRPDGIICLECGKLRKTLGSHVIFTHEMSLDDYREKWGFNRQTVFVAASTAAKLRRLALARKLGTYGSGANLAKARAARQWDEPWRLQARIEASEAKKRLYASGWQPRRYRKVDDRTLRRLAKEGLNLKRIARKAKLSVDQTRTRLQALGLLPPHRRRRLIDRRLILPLRQQGLWPLEIARRLRIEPQYVRKTLWQLRRQGVTIPTPSRPRPITSRLVTDDAFLRAFRRGGSTAQIARRLGVTRGYVIGKTWYLRRRRLIPAVRPRA